MTDASRRTDDDCDDRDDDRGGRALQLPNASASVLAGGAVTLDVLTTGLGAGAKLVSYKGASGDMYADQNGDLLYLADSDKFLKLASGQTKTDVITYKVEDAQGHVATGQVTVTITGAAPSATDFHGGPKSQVLIGGDPDERFFAGGGGDGVFGNGGNDTIYGGGGSDLLFGGDGNDLIVAGKGSDWLYGDYGNDTYVGGGGADVFVFTDFWADDVVLGFDAKKDTIQLPQVYFTKFSEVMAAAHDDGHGNLVISTPSHEGHIDTITLVGVSANQLRASDFVFI